MALPTKAKTWAIDTNNVSTGTTVPIIMGDCLLGIKNSLLTASGASVKGSCNGTTGAMDAADRWSTSANVQTRGANTTSAQSWIVIDLANMGGAELLITYMGSSTNIFSVYFSPGGNYVAAGTATHKPTASDEVTIASAVTMISSSIVRHLWTTWISSDGSALYFAIAASGAWLSGIALQLVTSRVGVGTFSPAVAGIKFRTAGSGTLLSSWGTAAGACRLDPGGGAVNIAGFFGIEGAKTGIAATLYPSYPELQGSRFMFPVSMWSETATATGAVCWFIDLWAGNVNASDGSMYPDAVTRSFIQFGDFILPWDGTAIVMV